MLKNLRPRQQEVLEILRKETAPVTYTQLQERMGYRSNAARKHVAALENMGFIQPRRKNDHRTIALSAAGRAALAARKAA